MDYDFYLVNVKKSTFEDGTSNEISTDNETPKLYLKDLVKIQLDTFVITHGSFTSVIGEFFFFVFFFFCLFISSCCVYFLNGPRRNSV